MNIDRSRRWTLLCWLTICLTWFLLLILFLSIEFFDWNRETSFNVVRFRSALIHCGRSVVDRVNSSRWFDQFEQRTNLLFSSQRDELISWLERVETRCSLARQLTANEEERPKVLRTLVSFFRKEFFYLMTFFSSTTKISF